MMTSTIDSLERLLVRVKSRKSSGRIVAGTCRETMSADGWLKSAASRTDRSKGDRPHDRVVLQKRHDYDDCSNHDISIMPTSITTLFEDDRLTLMNTSSQSRSGIVIVEWRSRARPIHKTPSFFGHDQSSSSSSSSVCRHETQADCRIG